MKRRITSLKILTEAINEVMTPKMEMKAPNSIRDFASILTKIDNELTKKMRKLHGGKTGGDDTPMFNNRPKDLGDNYFSYEFDGYLTTIVRFNDNGTIDAWYDSYSKEKILSTNRKSDETFKSVDDMIDKKSTELSKP